MSFCLGVFNFVYLSGKPVPTHLLRWQGLAAGNYSFALERLSKIPLAGEAGAPSAFARLGLK